MSEPARQYPSHESGRPAPGPLRDWLAAMKAHTPPVPERPATVRQEAPRAAEPQQSWAPRLVPGNAAQAERAPAGPARAGMGTADGEDMSELMAENLMLKAKLRIEQDRYAELQAMLAQEIRDLRKHVQDEMSALESVREERDLWQARAEALAQPLFQKR
ncbi:MULTISPECIES: hypothetical protein [Methylobacterium]|uniref:hypothetical protein n=1 Tax=Methylobacterium TaxID=407 RepID=UPI001043E105|nr:MULTISPECIES: hypothetical protein [Methylobacterium]MDR7036418.1 FtsZ-binding cell division protein ZapB [Methylobacterium sp. BE186]